MKTDKEFIDELEKECAALRECLIKVSTLSTNHFPKENNPITDLIWKYRPTVHPDVRTTLNATNERNTCKHDFQPSSWRCGAVWNCTKCGQLRSGRITQ